MVTSQHTQCAHDKTLQFCCLTEGMNNMQWISFSSDMVVRFFHSEVTSFIYIYRSNAQVTEYWMRNTTVMNINGYFLRSESEQLWPPSVPPQLLTKQTHNWLCNIPLHLSWIIISQNTLASFSMFTKSLPIIILFDATLPSQPVSKQYLYR